MNFPKSSEDLRFHKFPYISKSRRFRYLQKPQELQIQSKPCDTVILWYIPVKTIGWDWFPSLWVYSFRFAWLCSFCCSVLRFCGSKCSLNLYFLAAHQNFEKHEWFVEFLWFSSAHYQIYVFDNEIKILRKWAAEDLLHFLGKWEILDCSDFQVSS